MRVLLMRFSALGDLALLVPVVKALCEQNPDCTFALLSRPFAADLFRPIPVKVYGAQLKSEHSSLKGLGKLYREVQRDFQPDLVLDMHYVLRTRILSLFFKMKGTAVQHLEKNRADRKRLTARNKTDRPVLPHTTLRYAQVATKAGLKLQFSPTEKIKLSYSSPAADAFYSEEAQSGLIPLALSPTARHQEKMYPLDKWLEALKPLEDRCQFFIFGGPEERKMLLDWAASLQQTVVVAGRLKLGEELALMAKMQAFAGLDSANLHLSKLVGLTSISIWGATHRDAGFGPIGEHNYTLEIDVSELSCRPCSIFGNKTCWRGDHACMRQIESQRLRSILEDVLLEN